MTLPSGVLAATKLLESSFNLAQGSLVVESCNKLGDKQGFLSNIYRLVLHISEKPSPGAGKDDVINGSSKNGFPKSVVVKLCSNQSSEALADVEGSEKLDDLVEFISKIHWKECRFYALIAELSGSLRSRHIGIDVIAIPNIYVESHTTPQSVIENRCKDEAGLWDMLVMEDLSTCAQIPFVTNGLTVAQINAVIDGLAQFHAALWVTSEIWLPAEFLGKDIQGLKTMMIQIANGTADKMVQSHPTKFTIEHREKVDKLNVEQFWDQELGSRTRGKTGEDVDWKDPPVIIHGDLWAHNVMFAKDPASSAGELTSNVAAIIDWQFCSIGRPTHDLARLVYSSVDTEVRRANEARFLERYCDRINEKIDMFSEYGLVVGRESVSFEEVEKWWVNSVRIGAMGHLVDLQVHFQFIKGEPDEEQLAENLLDRFLSALDDAARLSALGHLTE